MPLLPPETGTFLQRVTDSLRFGQDAGERASVTLESTVAGGVITVESARPGASSNSWTLEVTEPAGTSALAVTRSGDAITVALGVSSGSAVGGANTMDLIAGAINSALPELSARVTTQSAEEITDPVAAASFSGGSDSVAGEAAPRGGGYLRAQDLGIFLELLQEACAADLTATGGSTTTAIVASIPNGGEYAGAKVTFAADTTTVALQGAEATVLSHNATTFTFTEALAAAVANTDTFSIEIQLVSPALASLYEGANKTKGDAPAGSVYGESRIALDAIAKLVQQVGGAAMPVRVLSRVGVVTKAGSTASEVKSVDSMRIDAFKGRNLVLGGETRRIVGNTEDTFLLAKELASAPAAGASFAIQEPTVGYRAGVTDLANVHPGGGHPNNAFMAYLLEQAQKAVEELVLPA